jgi:signal peptidase II
MTGQARLKRGLVVAGIVLVLDQAVKYAMLQYLIYGFRPSVEVLPFFNLVVVWNYGISFGMFNTGSSASAYLFAGLALAIVAGLLWWLRNAENGTVVLAIVSVSAPCSIFSTSTCSATIGRRSTSPMRE